MLQIKTKIIPEKVNNHIVAWLKNYAIKAGVQGFVVGVSGGIDSAVTSTLCAQTGLKTICLQLPIHQAKSHVDRKEAHISQLKAHFPNVSSIDVNLSDAFDLLQNTFPVCKNEKALALTLANTRARLRMTTLYYIAGIHGLLVAGTGNKVEDFGVGFYTKYGDGGVDISPIADLMKSEVFALGHFLQVPTSILHAAPTDGLFGDDRSDEDQLGASYDELEWAMTFAGKSEFCSAREQEVLAIFKKLNSSNQHKMNPIPVCAIPSEYRTNEKN
jgi:NAD+ synthase